MHNGIKSDANDVRLNEREVIPFKMSPLYRKVLLWYRKKNFSFYTGIVLVVSLLTKCLSTMNAIGHWIGFRYISLHTERIIITISLDYPFLPPFFYITHGVLLHLVCFCSQSSRPKSDKCTAFVFFRLFSPPRERFGPSFWSLPDVRPEKRRLMRTGSFNLS